MPEEHRPPHGCAVFGLHGGMFRRRRTASMSSLSRLDAPPAAAPAPANPARRSHRAPRDSDDSALSRRPNALPLPAPENTDSRAPAQPSDRNKPSRTARDTKASPAPAAADKYTGMAADLDKMIHDHQKVKSTTQLVRATSGNMMLHRNLGNLNAAVPGAAAASRDAANHLPKTAKEQKAGNGYACSGMGNIVKEAKPPELSRALSHRTDPEKLKEMGNEEYRQGRYVEAVALYDQAIMVEPRRPAYWSNKAAALTALGRLIEAVSDCKEAVRIDPSYCRAHHRLGGLYLRLGEPGKAIHHFKQSVKEPTSTEVARALSVKSRIAKCHDARKLKNWITVLQESQAAVSDGADCALQVLALQAEALLKIQKHDEADSVFNRAPVFGVDESTMFFGTTGHAYVLRVRAQVVMAAGRFEDAVALAETASQLDPANREIANVLRRANAVASARSRGNDLFKAGKFAEACVAYGEGLGKETNNAVLLCNRAACHARLGRHEKAVEDCDSALAVRPSYSKARLRRADCNAKLERWEVALRDYQVLMQDLPGNEEVSKAVSEAEARLHRQRNEDTTSRPQQ